MQCACVAGLFVCQGGEDWGRRCGDVVVELFDLNFFFFYLNKIKQMSFFAFSQVDLIALEIQLRSKNTLMVGLWSCKNLQNFSKIARLIKGWHCRGLGHGARKTWFSCSTFNHPWIDTFLLVRSVIVQRKCITFAISVFFSANKTMIVISFLFLKLFFGLFLPLLNRTVKRDRKRGRERVGEWHTVRVRTDRELSQGLTAQVR